MTTRKFYKFKLLLDENFPPRTHFPTLNNRHNVKHIKIDLHHIGLPDDQVYTIAVEEKRLIITFNDKDFRGKAILSNDSGVIGVSPNLKDEHIDKKLVALLRKSKPSELYGDFTYISGQT